MTLLVTSFVSSNCCSYQILICHCERWKKRTHSSKGKSQMIQDFELDHSLPCMILILSDLVELVVNHGKKGFRAAGRSA
jgi:hypothetical protein